MVPLLLRLVGSDYDFCRILIISLMPSHISFRFLSCLEKYFFVVFFIHPVLPCSSAGLSALLHIPHRLLVLFFCFFKSLIYHKGTTLTELEFRKKLKRVKKEESAKIGDIKCFCMFLRTHSFRFFNFCSCVRLSTT